MKRIYFSLLAFIVSFYNIAQSFQDNLSNELIGDFPSQWDLVSGMATIDQQDGYKYISFRSGGIIKPIVNNQTNNYLSEDFTVEFDVFFDQTSSLYGQSFQLRLWDGAYGYDKDGIRYKPFMIYRDGLETDWNHPEMGSAKNHLKEFQTLDPVWRHIKVEVTEGKLKILMDDKLILFLPRFKMQPTMVSIGGGVNDSQYPAKIGFTNFSVYELNIPENSEQTGEISTTINTPNGETKDTSIDENVGFNPVDTTPVSQIDSLTIQEPFDPIDTTTNPQILTLGLIEAANYDMEQINAAILHPDGTAHFFINDRFHKYRINDESLLNIGKIGTEGWYGSPDYLDATVKLGNYGYLFKGNKYYIYNFTQYKVMAEGIIGQTAFYGIPENLDAAIFNSNNGDAYFFKGDKYYRYNVSQKKVTKVGILGTDGWFGVPINLTAAITHPNGHAYLFKGDNYYRYNYSLNRVDKQGVVNKDGWKNLFIKIDAVAALQTQYAHFYFVGNKCYKSVLPNDGFNGDMEFTTYNMGTNIFYGVPTHIDAAAGTKGFEVYFFKDDRYYIYSTRNNKIIEEGRIGIDGFKDMPTHIDAAYKTDNYTTVFFKDMKYYMKKASGEIEIGDISTKFEIPDNVDAAFGMIHTGAPNGTWVKPGIIKKTWLYTLNSGEPVMKDSQNRQNWMINLN